MATARKLRGAAALARSLHGVAVAVSTPSYRSLRPHSLHTLRHGCNSSPSSFYSFSSGRLGAKSGGVSGSIVSFSVAAAQQEAFSHQSPSSTRYLSKEIVLYQYESCPFCNKVKAFLDFYALPYEIVEVNPISKKEIGWSNYKKVPILKVDGQPMVNSSDIIDRMFRKIHPEMSVGSDLDSDEIKKWRGWVDNHLVHVLSPNIYRTPVEAIESFDYITSHGNFSFTERLVAKYCGAAAMYFVSKKLKKKHNITNERAALYEAAETWVDALNGRKFLGGLEPNLADLAVFGVLRPICHLKSGKDMVEHTRIGEWYGLMEREMESRGRMSKAE